MYNNIFKFNQVLIKNNDTLMIDNNEKVARKIEYLEKMIQKEAKDEKFAESADGFITGLGESLTNGFAADEEDSSVIKVVPPKMETTKADTLKAEPPKEGAAQLEPMVQPQGKKADTGDSLQIISAQAQEILAEARKEAERIKSKALSEAQREIEELRQQMFEEGKAQGYESGYNEGMAQVESRRRSLEEEHARLEKEYHEMVNELEPKFVETLTDIYEKVLKVDLSKDHEILVHLISSAMHKMEGSSNYLIHVSKEDYQYVNLKKEEALVSVVSPHSSVEIVEDMTLGSNACIIETDGGVFDCGLGTQLEELSQKLRLLSYTRT